MQPKEFDLLSPEAVSHVVFEIGDGIEVTASVMRLTAHSVAFEVCAPQAPLQLSEVLGSFRIHRGAQVVYEGPAVISGAISAGTTTIYEVGLRLPLIGRDLPGLDSMQRIFPAAFHSFLDHWEIEQRLLPNYKLAVVEIESFLQELRRWLDQIELGLQGLPQDERQLRERAILGELRVHPILNALFERFESVAASVPPDRVHQHQRYCRQRLHPLLMSSPFMHRIYAKPLGYAGDHEMIDMIIRNGNEGPSLFARILNRYILDQSPAHSVRNRAASFVDRFVQETSRISSQGRTASIFSLGCGPAREVEKFIASSALANRAQFRLLDFDAETLAKTGSRMDEVRQKHHRTTSIKLVKQSVHSILKEGTRSSPTDDRFDLIYCSGLYDYLSDRVCKTLNSHLYDLLRPGGLLMVTNFDPFNPIRYIMEHMFEWFLIHRDASQLVALAPDQADRDECLVQADPTSCNIFLEIRKHISRE